MKLAASIIIPRWQDKSAGHDILAVSRKRLNEDGSLRWGLPGGKVDPGEDVLQACMRETLEETGLRFYPNELIPIYAGASAGDTNFWVMTFLAKITPPNLEKVIIPEDGLQWCWQPMVAMCDRDVSPFWRYNIMALEAHKQYRGEAKSWALG